MDWQSPVARASLRAGLALISIAFCIGCSERKTPLEVEITQLARYSHPAKAPDCRMPVLPAMPVNAGTQLAIVEAWADEKDQSSDVLPAIQRKACETGADALVIIGSQRQDIQHLLYAATPDTMVDQQQRSGYSQEPGDQRAINDADRVRQIGQEGHNGFYIDAIAIEYGAPKDNPSAAPSNSTVIDSSRDRSG